MATYSLYPHMIFPLCVPVSYSPLLPRIPGISHNALVPTLLTTFNLLPIKNFISKYSHTLSYWGLGLQHAKLKGQISFHNRGDNRVRKEPLLFICGLVLCVCECNSCFCFCFWVIKVSPRDNGRSGKVSLDKSVIEFCCKVDQYNGAGF